MQIRIDAKDSQKLRLLFDSLAWNVDFSDYLNEELLNDVPLTDGPVHEFLKTIEPGKNKIIPARLTGYEEKGIEGHLSKIEHLDPAYYESDPVGKALLGLSFKEGDYELSKKVLRPYTLFLKDEITGVRGRLYAENAPLGFFDRPYEYCDLSYKGQTWMSLLPHEINTMKDVIAASHGKVVLLGLGLGYAAASMALKDNVEEVRVVEKDREIISIFERFIRPRLASSAKITVVEGDAMDYRLPEDADFLFADLWHNEEDGLPMYLQLVEKEGKIPHYYWIEKSLITYFRRIVMEEIAEEAEGFSPEGGDGEIERIFSRLKDFLKEKSLTGYQAIEDFLSDANLTNLIRLI